jgi:hypothetical protein
MSWHGFMGNARVSIVIAAPKLTHRTAKLLGCGRMHPVEAGGAKNLVGDAAASSVLKAANAAITPIRKGEA